MAKSNGCNKINVIINFLVKKSFYNSRRKVYLAIVDRHGEISETLVRECDFQRRNPSQSLLKSVSSIVHTALGNPPYLHANFALYLSVETIHDVFKLQEFFYIPEPLGDSGKNNTWKQNILPTSLGVTFFLGKNQILSKPLNDPDESYVEEDLEITKDEGGLLRFKLSGTRAGKSYTYIGTAYVRNNILFFRGQREDCSNGFLLMQFAFDWVASPVNQGFQLISCMPEKEKIIHRTVVFNKLRIPSKDTKTNTTQINLLLDTPQKEIYKKEAHTAVIQRILDDNLKERFQLIVDSLIYHGVCNNRAQAYSFLAEKVHQSKETLRGYDLNDKRIIQRERLTKVIDAALENLSEAVTLSATEIMSSPVGELRKAICGFNSNCNIQQTYAVYSQSITANNTPTTTLLPSYYTEEIVTLTQINQDFYHVYSEGLIQEIGFKYSFHGIAQQIEGLLCIEGSIEGEDSDGYLFAYFTLPENKNAHMYGYQVVRGFQGLREFVRRRVILRPIDKPRTPNSSPRNISDGNLTALEVDYLSSDPILKWTPYVMKK